MKRFDVAFRGTLPVRASMFAGLFSTAVALALAVVPAAAACPTGAVTPKQSVEDVELAISAVEAAMPDLN